jgi:predicted O-linked N-acetylglucosamine transferase (SPINDLY family)
MVAMLSPLIAKTPDEYLDICHNLASDPPRLAVTGGALRERMRQSPLCDAPRFTRNLEAAFREMWRSRCRALR